MPKHHPDNERFVVVDPIEQAGKLDEPKALIGFDSIDENWAGHRANDASGAPTWAKIDDQNQQSTAAKAEALAPTGEAPAPTAVDAGATGADPAAGPAAELFARAGTLYDLNSDLLRVTAPKSYEAYRRAFSGRSQGDQGGLQDEVQQLQPRRVQDGEPARGGARVPVEREGRGGEWGSDGLRRLRDEVVRVFEASRDGASIGVDSLSAGPISERPPDPIRSALQSELRKITANWANAPHVIVIDTMDDSPAEAQRENAAQMQSGASGKPAATLNRLPDSLAGPAMVLAVEFDGTPGRMRVGFVTSAYPKDGGADLFVRDIRDGGVLFANKAKSRQLASTAVLHLPGVVQRAVGFSAEKYPAEVDLSQRASGAWFQRDRLGQPSRMACVAVQAEIDRIKATWANTPKIVVLASMGDPKAPEAARRSNEAQLQQGATGQPSAFALDAQDHD